ncbi:MAG: HEPN domain-containing protein [Euryarchaeota archaeon]|nr:HEPN domain-containing protein [Euryarchaeota archaeon]
MKREIVLRWMQKAENDLKIVEQLIESEDAPADMLCFHCQQAVEKYLKAYLTWVDLRVRKTHDLETILNLCIKKDKKFEKLKKKRISELTIYATEVRYPEEFIESTGEDVRESYQMAKEVKIFVIKRLRETGLKELK